MMMTNDNDDNDNLHRRGRVGDRLAGMLHAYITSIIMMTNDNDDNDNLHRRGRVGDRLAGILHARLDSRKGSVICLLLFNTNK